jgi:hypothetical protein
MATDNNTTHPYLYHLHSLHTQLMDVMQMLDHDLPPDWFVDNEGHELAEVEHARWWSVIDMVRDAIATNIVQCDGLSEKIKESVFDELLGKMQQLKTDLAAANRRVAELESTK